MTAHRNTLNRTPFERLVGELANGAQRRYHSAILEGRSEKAAFEEIVRIILETYREVLAS